MIPASLATLAAVVAAYAVVIEPRRVERTFLRVVIPAMPRALRLLVVGDLHLRERSRTTFSQLRSATDWAMAEGATAALVLGDLIERDDEVDMIGRHLATSLAPLRAFYVSGNHELDRSGRMHWPLKRNDAGLIRRVLSTHGIECIDDRTVDLGGVGIHGVPWQGWRVGHDRGPIEHSGGMPIVLATHSPDHIAPIPGMHVLLAMCGHTHGGQIRIPGLGAPWIPVIRALEAPAGAMVLDGVSTYVTRGLSATFPVRLGARPEVVLLELAPWRGDTPARVRVVELQVD